MRKLNFFFNFKKSYFNISKNLYKQPRTKELESFKNNKLINEKENLLKNRLKENKLKKNKYIQKKQDEIIYYPFIDKNNLKKNDFYNLKIKEEALNFFSSKAEFVIL
jgi:hypothetical protein